MLTAKLLPLSLVPRHLPMWLRCNSSSSSSSKGTIDKSTSQSEGDKSVKEPKKPFEMPKVTAVEAEEMKTPPAAPKEPFDNSKYQVSEYYGHNIMSFYDIECSMTPFRKTPPSPLKKPA